MKEKLQLLALGLLVVGWFCYQAYSDYSWSENMIRNKTAEGWVLAVSQDNYAGPPLHPWTWFKTPVTGLWFIKPGMLRKFKSTIVTPVLNVQYDYSETDEKVNIKFFDLMGKSAFLPENVSLKNVNFDDLKWYTFPPKSPGQLLINAIELVLMVQTLEKTEELKFQSNAILF